MEIVDFSTTEFRDIPEQDNPAFGDSECILMVKQYKTNRIVIHHIIPDPIESVNHIAIVWKKENAILFCAELARR